MLATSRPTGDTSAESHTWTVEADDYDSALTRARSEVPEGPRCCSSDPNVDAAVAWGTRAQVAEQRAMLLVRAYEEQHRGAQLVDVSAGLEPQTSRFISDSLLDAGRDPDHAVRVPSADYLSRTGAATGGARLIEV
jgi:hypothetical protein